MINKKRIKHLMWRLDVFADNLVREGIYYKKELGEIKKELKKL